jgi:hypothetical protein
MAHSGRLRPGGKRDRPVRAPSARQRLPDLEADSDPGEPILADGYRDALEVAATRSAEARLRDGHGVLKDPVADEFEELVKLALRHVRDILQLELNPEHKNFLRVLSAKQAASSSVLTATARVREGLLRPVNDDGVEALLRRVKGTGGVRVDEVGVVLAPVTVDDLFN